MATNNADTNEYPEEKMKEVSNTGKESLIIGTTPSYLNSSNKDPDEISTFPVDSEPNAEATLPADNEEGNESVLSKQHLKSQLAVPLETCSKIGEPVEKAHKNSH